MANSRQQAYIEPDKIPSQQGDDSASSQNASDQSVEQSDTSQEINRISMGPGNMLYEAQDKFSPSDLAEIQQNVSEEMSSGQKFLDQLYSFGQIKFQTNCAKTSIMFCPICQENYNGTDHQPLCLPCGHSLCRPCVNHLKVSQTRGVCPFDRRYFYFISEYLPVNFALLEAIEEGIGVKCLTHGQTVLGFCKDHSLLLCGKCMFQHRYDDYIDIVSNDAKAIVAEKRERLRKFSFILKRSISKWTKDCKDNIEIYNKANHIIQKYVNRLRKTEGRLIKKIRGKTISYIETVRMITDLLPINHEAKTQDIIDQLRVKVLGIRKSEESELGSLISEEQ